MTCLLDVEHGKERRIKDNCKFLDEVQRWQHLMLKKERERTSFEEKQIFHLNKLSLTC